MEGPYIRIEETGAVVPLSEQVTTIGRGAAVDVHLGDARLLKANHLTFAAGDSVRVVGENVPYGTATQFFARIIQKGSQTLTLRSARGFPLRPASKAGKSQAGVL